MTMETVARQKHICQGEYVNDMIRAAEIPKMAPNNLAAMERLFASLADRTRLRLLNLMAEREVCVCYFIGVLDLPQPTISRHLAYLRRNGVVTSYRDGKWMHYRIAVPEDQATRQVLTDTLRWLAEDKDMQKDRARLIMLRQIAVDGGMRSDKAQSPRACCTPQELRTIRRAPLPTATADLVSGKK